MCNILISLGKPATPELLDAILVALSAGWGEAKVEVAGNTTVISFDSGPVVAELPPEPTAAMPAFTDNAPIEVPAVNPADVIDAITAIEIPALAPSIEVAPANPAPIGLPNAIIKSLSLSTQCHAVFDPSLQVSTLKVKNVSEAGDLLVFTFGGAEYKYPMFNHKINVVICFAGKEDEQISCSLAVVSTDGEDELALSPSDYTPSVN